MTKSLLPVSPGALALSLTAHAAALAGLVLAASWLGDLAPRAGAAGSGALRVALVGPDAVPASLSRTREEAPAREEVPRAERAPVEEAPVAALPAVASAPPDPTAVRPASPARRDPPAAVPLPEPSPPAPLVSRAPPVVASPSASAAAAPAAPAAGEAAAFASGVPGRVGPDWPGPGEVDRVARPRWPIRPEYPPRARRSGEESTVVVEAWVDEVGAVAFASVLRSGGSEFDESARLAVRRSAFRPARLGGSDVASRVALRIHFELYD